MKQLLSFWLLAFLVFRLAAQPSPVDSIPFYLGNDNRIYVHCWVNDSDTLRFLFDTGASDMVINSNSPRTNFSMIFNGKVQNTGATGSNEVRISSGNQFSLGRQTFKNMSFISVPYPPDAWDGVIGLSFIKQQITWIDYQKMMIYLYDTQHFQAPEQYISFPIEYVFQVPILTIPVMVNGNNYNLKLEIDTGSDRILDLNTPFVEQHQLLGTQKPYAISQINSSDGKSGVLYNIYLDEVKIGKYILPRIPGAFSTVKEGIQSQKEMDGVIGNNFLKRFNMICDFGKGLVYLAPNDQLYSPFYSFLVK